MPLGAMWLIRPHGEMPQFFQKGGLEVSLWAEQWLGTGMLGISVALVVPLGETPQPLLICSVSPLGPLPMQEPGW